MTCNELCFVGSTCSAVCDSPECISNRIEGIRVYFFSSQIPEDEWTRKQAEQSRLAALAG